MDRAEYEKQYPVANTSGDATTIAQAFKRWQPRAVIAGIAAPPTVSTLRLGAACDASLDGVLEFPAGEGDQAKTTLAYTFEDARRGRYLNVNDHDRTLRHMAKPILVLSIAETVAPEMIGSGSQKTYEAGSRTGSAYVYDIDGTLQCAGTFQAESSDVVKYSTWKSDDPRINGNPEVDAKRAVANDLDTATRAAAVAGLRRVVPL